jgi:dTDP-4-amino-4,6-dideoxyglucose
MEPYRSHPAVHTPVPLPRTEALAERILVLPGGAAVASEDVDAVCEIIRLFVGH